MSITSSTAIRALVRQLGRHRCQRAAAAVAAARRTLSTTPMVWVSVQKSRARLQTWRTSQEAYSPEEPSRILRSRYPDVQVPKSTFTDHLFQEIDRHQDRTALVCGMSGRSYTFGDVQDLMRRVASGLARRGFAKGEVCAIISPNIPEFAILYYAIASLGGIITTANPLYTAEEISRQLNDCGAKFVITIPHISDTIKQAVSNSPTVQEVFVAGEYEGFTPLMQLASDEGDAFPENLQIDPEEDILCLPYSSGTTGPPKGVMITHQNILANIAQMSTPDLLGEIVEDDIILAILPMFHIYGMVVVMALGFSRKCKVITLPKFEPEMFLEAVREYRPTVLPLVPPIISFLAKSPLVKSNDFDSVRFVNSGAAPLGHNLTDAFLEKIHPHTVTFREGYGMTESSPVILLSPKVGSKIGSCGVLVPNTEAKVVDVDTGEAVGVMQPGELFIRGPQVMKGYYKNPTATAETIDSEGWLHTGDIVIYDDEEHFKIIDRLKELIKVKGFQVSPSELEDLLLKHEGIQDAAVIGIPDSRAGELPRAFIVRKDPNLTEEDVALFIEKQVSAHKHLKGGIEFRDTIPKTLTGKILHRELKTEYNKRIAEEK